MVAGRARPYLGGDVADEAEEDGALADGLGRVDAEAKLQDARGEDEEERVQVDGEDHWRVPSFSRRGPPAKLAADLQQTT